MIMVSREEKMSRCFRGILPLFSAGFEALRFYADVGRDCGAEIPIGLFPARIRLTLMLVMHPLHIPPVTFRGSN